MRRGPPCVLCGNVGRTVRYRCGCGGRHVVCAMCVIVQKLVDTEGPDSDELRTCPDALKVADALMHEEPKVTEVDDGAFTRYPNGGNPILAGNICSPVKVLPATAAEGDMRFRETDNTIHLYDKGQWILVSATP